MNVALDWLLCAYLCVCLEEGGGVNGREMEERRMGEMESKCMRERGEDTRKREGSLISDVQRQRPLFFAGIRDTNSTIPERQRQIKYQNRPNVHKHTRTANILQSNFSCI